MSTHSPDPDTPDPHSPDPHSPDPHALGQSAASPAPAPPAEDADPGSTRSQSRPRSRSPIWLTAAVVVVLLAVGVIVNNTTADDNPHPGAAVSFSVGEDVTLQNFHVHINSARLAEVLLDDEKRLETSGLWLIVDLSYANLRRPEILSELGVRDSQGRTYTVSDRYTWGTWMAAPDLWFRGEVVFEVPASAVADGEVELLVWPSGRAQAESVPMPYGTTRLSVDATDITTRTVEVARSELLPAGER